MSTFATFITNLYDEIANRNTQTLTQIRRCTVRQLRELSAERVLFTEKAATFATVVGQATYDSAATGFPANLQEVLRLYYASGTANVFLEVTDLELLLSFGSTQALPTRWAWFNNKLYLAPVPSSVVTMSIHYLEDGTKDSTTGATITESSTTQTNSWLDRGETALRWAVLADLYKGPLHLDQEKAGFADLKLRESLARLRNERVQRKREGGAANIYWTGDEPEVVDPTQP